MTAPATVLWLQMALRDRLRPPPWSGAIAAKPSRLKRETSDRIAGTPPGCMGRFGLALGHRALQLAG